MNNKEAQKIIKNYKPHKGFFDLSEKPGDLDDIEYARILKTQNFLVEQNEQREYLKKYNHNQWDNLKELSAKLQGIIFSYWDNSIFN